MIGPRASAEQLQDLAVGARTDLTMAQDRERDLTVAFMRRARQEKWSWTRIGVALGVTATAARRHFNRNER